MSAFPLRAPRLARPRPNPSYLVLSRRASAHGTLTPPTRVPCHALSSPFPRTCDVCGSYVYPAEQQACAVLPDPTDSAAAADAAADGGGASAAAGDGAETLAASMNPTWAPFLGVGELAATLWGGNRCTADPQIRTRA